jgi:hypothetical protein
VIWHQTLIHMLSVYKPKGYFVYIYIYLCMYGIKNVSESIKHIKRPTKMIVKTHIYIERDIINDHRPPIEGWQSNNNIETSLMFIHPNTFILYIFLTEEKEEHLVSSAINTILLVLIYIYIYKQSKNSMNILKTN